MSHEDVKLEAWQAAVSPKLDCCTEPTLKASGRTVGSLPDCWFIGGLCEEAMLFIV
jgi:hypothetical protein